MTIRTKIRAVYAGAGLIVSLAVLWSVTSLRTMASATRAILQENYRSILAADNMIGALERQDSGLLLALLGERGRATSELGKGRVDFDRWYDAAAGNVTLPGEGALIQELRRTYEEFTVEVNRLLDLPLPGGQALDHYLRRALPLFRQVRAAAERLREVNQDAMVTASDRAIAVGRDAVATTIVLGGLLLLAASVGGEMLTRRVLHPLSLLSAATDAVAAGDYQVALPEASADEVGHLTDRFAAMARKLKAYQDLNVGRVVAEKLRSDSMIRDLADGVVLLDRDLAVVRMNPSAGTVLGVEPGPAMGRPVSELIHDPTVLDRIREPARRATGAPPGAGRDVVLEVEHEGRVGHYRVVVTEVTGDSPEARGRVLLLQDITQFRELDRLKTEFVATASHELRTPLTSMAMGLHLLRETALPSMAPADRALLEAAIEDTDRMRLLVDDLLDLSRIESGQLAVRAESVSLAPLLVQVASRFHPQAEAAGVTLRTDVPEPLPPAMADPTRIGWVLSNLLGNALKYCGPRGHVLVTAEAVGSWVQVSVADDGPGIPVELQSQVFGKFVRGREASVPGSGLGLAIVKAIVDAHGGSVWVDSAPGQGSTFTFILPRAGGTGPTTGGNTRV